MVFGQSLYDLSSRRDTGGGVGGSAAAAAGGLPNRRGSKLSDAMEKKFRMGEKRGKRDKQGEETYTRPAKQCTLYC